MSSARKLVTSLEEEETSTNSLSLSLLVTHENGSTPLLNLNTNTSTTTIQRLHHCFSASWSLSFSLGFSAKSSIDPFCLKLKGHLLLLLNSPKNNTHHCSLSFSLCCISINAPTTLNLHLPNFLNSPLLYFKSNDLRFLLITVLKIIRIKRCSSTRKLV